MSAARRAPVSAAVALTVAGAITAAPSVPQPAEIAEIPAAGPAVRLVNDSLLNVPLNLFYDLANIPYQELQAIEFAARSLFFSGPWFVVSPTNLWGVDPGDPSHFMAVMNFLVPFPELSGMFAMDDPGQQTDFNAGLGQQMWAMMAAVLPTSSGCDVDGCAPIVSESPITGATSVDFFLWLSKVLLGQERFPLFESWFQVSFDQLFKGFYFDPGADASTNPSGAAYPGFGFPGTHQVIGPDGTVYENAMPWSGDTYTLNPFVPLQNFFNSLMADPDTTGLFGTGIHVATPEEIGRTLQAFTASLAMFDPFTPGSPFCQGQCDIVTDAHRDYPDIIKAIGNMWPGNPLIDEWVNGYDHAPGAEPVNIPTEAQIQTAIQLLQQEFWDFANPPEPDGYNLEGIDFSSWAPFFHQLWTWLGFDVPPLADGASGAGDAAAVPVDLSTLNPADWS